MRRYHRPHLSTLERLWWLSVLTAPWSVEMAVTPSLRLSVPQEPLLALILVMFLRVGPMSVLTPIKPCLTHPIIIAAGATLVWTAVATTFSSAPLVSFKVLLVRTTQAVVYTLGGIAVLRKQSDTKKLAFVGAFGLVPVAVWALVRAHIVEGWQAVHASATPFFPNRLELTVIAAFWLVTLLGARRFSSTPLTWLAGGPLLAAVVLLHGRAAIVALVVGLTMWWVLRLQPRPGATAAAVLLLSVITSALAFDFSQWRETAALPFRAHGVLDSVWRAVENSEAGRDESLLERVNRWRCAVLMAAERPVVGYGPGTFENEYGVFQRPQDRTRWSTDDGDLGDAHSELLGRLAEEGVTGAMLQITLLAILVLSGVRATFRVSFPDHRAAAAGWTSAAVALAVAGIFVGVADLSGTGLAVWLTAAVLVILDQAGAGTCEASTSSSGPTA